MSAISQSRARFSRKNLKPVEQRLGCLFVGHVGRDPLLTNVSLAQLADSVLTFGADKKPSHRRFALLVHTSTTQAIRPACQKRQNYQQRPPYSALTSTRSLAIRPSATNSSGVDSSGIPSSISAAFACWNAPPNDRPNHCIERSHPGAEARRPLGHARLSAIGLRLG
jgi:hypothetical protein